MANELRPSKCLLASSSFCCRVLSTKPYIALKLSPKAEGISSSTTSSVRSFWLAMLLAMKQGFSGFAESFAPYSDTS